MYFMLTFNSKFWPKKIQNIVTLAILNKNVPISYFFHGNFIEVGEPARQVARMTGFQVSESSSELSPREYIRNYQIGLARLIVEL